MNCASQNDTRLLLEFTYEYSHLLTVQRLIFLSGRIYNPEKHQGLKSKLRCANRDRSPTSRWHLCLPCGRLGEGWHYGGLWVLSLGSSEMLPLGYQPSPMTLCWSSRADLLFHYHRASRSMERRHHYPSGLMRLSRCRKRSGNYCRCSFQPGDVTRAERDGGEPVQTDTLCRGCINTELNMKNGNIFPFIANVESIAEANKDILDVLITLLVKETTRGTTLVSICINNLCQWHWRS